MEWLSGIRSFYGVWPKRSPLPTQDCQTPAKFGRFISYEHTAKQWQPINSWKRTLAIKNATSKKEVDPADRPPRLSLVTWNIDSGGPMPEARINSILTCILDMRPEVDVVCLQEVSKPVLNLLMADENVRKGFFCTQVVDDDWGSANFVTVTLLSRLRFVRHGQYATPEQLVLGRTWRSRLPSHFGRDALCCDVSGSWAKAPNNRLRLINVHLDSLQMDPSYRPEQLQIVASLLEAATRGVVAGDFNPVSPQDRKPVSDYGLLDAWMYRRGDEPGFTWGHNQDQFPAARFDKVLLRGLKASAIDIVEPADVPFSAEMKCADEDPEVEARGQQEDLNIEKVKASDHWGVWCIWELPGPLRPLKSTEIIERWRRESL